MNNYKTNTYHALKVGTLAVLTLLVSCGDKDERNYSTEGLIAVTRATATIATTTRSVGAINQVRSSFTSGEYFVLNYSDDTGSSASLFAVCDNSGSEFNFFTSPEATTPAIAYLDPDNVSVTSAVSPVVPADISGYKLLNAPELYDNIYVSTDVNKDGSSAEKAINMRCYDALTTEIVGKDPNAPANDIKGGITLDLGSLKEVGVSVDFVHRHHLVNINIQRDTGNDHPFAVSQVNLLVKYDNKYYIINTSNAKIEEGAHGVPIFSRDDLVNTPPTFQAIIPNGANLINIEAVAQIKSGEPNNMTYNTSLGVSCTGGSSRAINLTLSDVGKIETDIAFVGWKVKDHSSIGIPKEGEGISLDGGETFIPSNAISNFKITNLVIYAKEDGSINFYKVRDELHTLNESDPSKGRRVSITLPDYTGSIPSQALMDNIQGFQCYWLTSFTANYATGSIGNNAFRYNQSLVSVSLPNFSGKIEVEAFYECGNLINLVLGGSGDIEFDNRGSFYNMPTVKCNLTINLNKKAGGIGKPNVNGNEWGMSMENPSAPLPWKSINYIEKLP